MSSQFQIYASSEINRNDVSAYGGDRKLQSLRHHLWSEVPQTKHGIRLYQELRGKLREHPETRDIIKAIEATRDITYGLTSIPAVQVKKIVQASTCNLENSRLLGYDYSFAGRRYTLRLNHTIEDTFTPGFLNESVIFPPIMARNDIAPGTYLMDDTLITYVSLQQHPGWVVGHGVYKNNVKKEYSFYNMGKLQWRVARDHVSIYDTQGRCIKTYISDEDNFHTSLTYKQGTLQHLSCSDPVGFYNYQRTPLKMIFGGGSKETWEYYRLYPGDDCVPNLFRDYHFNKGPAVSPYELEKLKGRYMFMCQNVIDSYHPGDIETIFDKQLIVDTINSEFARRGIIKAQTGEEEEEDYDKIGDETVVLTIGYIENITSDKDVSRRRRFGPYFSVLYTVPQYEEENDYDEASGYDGTNPNPKNPARDPSKIRIVRTDLRYYLDDQLTDKRTYQNYLNNKYYATMPQFPVDVTAIIFAYTDIPEIMNNTYLNSGVTGNPLQLFRVI
jgi:hypothetical protein